MPKGPQGPKRTTYRALTFIGLALFAFNVIQRSWLARALVEPGTAYTIRDQIRGAVERGWGITVSALLTIGLAYLWMSAKDSN